MKEATLGVDLGTSGVKVVALGPGGEVLAQATRSYPLITPQPGWAEQHPANWVSGTLAALRDVSIELSRQGAQPRALGLSGQMHGLVPLDSAGQVIRPALLWNDARTGPQVEQIERTVPRADLIVRTGNRAVAGFQLPKLLWLRQEEPQAFSRLALALLPKDYLGFVLTGQASTEPSDASGVGLLNLQTLDWDAELQSAFDLPLSLFPPVIPSHGVIGHLLPDLAHHTGLPAGLPVVAGAGDNAAAAVALGLSHLAPQRGSLSLGTSGVIFAPQSRPLPDPQGRVHLFAHADGGFHLLGVTLAAGGALQWLRDRIAPEKSFPELLAEAEAVPPGAEGVTFLPFLAGERSPWMNPDLRGAWAGLTLAHGRGHLTRALLEGVALSLRDTFQVMRPLCSVNELLVTGGGAASHLWLGMCAAATGLPLRLPMHIPGPAEGAAILATVPAGWHADVASAIRAFSLPAEQLDILTPLGKAGENYSNVRKSLYGQEAGLPDRAPLE